MNREFNFGQHIKGMKNTEVFTAREVMVPFKCDVHGWMTSYGGILDHPFFAVTSDGGKFELKNLPAGTYTVEAWHEKLGPQTQTVTVGEKETKDISFTFKAMTAGSTATRSLVVCSTVLLIAAGGHGDEHRLGPGGAGLAEHLRLVHVLVPAREDGRRHPLRARPPADREHGRIPDDHSGGLDVAGRPARLGAASLVSRRSAR